MRRAHKTKSGNAVLLNDSQNIVAKCSVLTTATFHRAGKLIQIISAFLSTDLAKLALFDKNFKVILRL